MIVLLNTKESETAKSSFLKIDFCPTLFRFICDTLQANINTQNLTTVKTRNLGNNKSGSGNYVFKVTPNGDVEFYNSSGQDMRLSVHVDL